MMNQNGDDHTSVQIMAESKCYFLELPPELRNRIYDLAVAKRNVIRVRPHGTQKTVITFRVPRQTTEPPLMRTCHQIRQEALAMRFAVNTFSFEITDALSPDVGTASLGKLGRVVQHIREVEVRLPCSHGVVFAVNIIEGKVSMKKIWQSSGHKNAWQIVGCRLQERNVTEAKALLGRINDERGLKQGLTEWEMMGLINILSTDFREQGRNSEGQQVGETSPI